MTGVVPAIPKLHFDGPGGVPLADGKLYTYRTASSTPATTYLDPSLNPASANANPVILDARGECVVWLDSAITYRFVLKSKLGVTIWTQDDISGVVGSGVFKSPSTEVQTATAGQSLFTLGTVTYEPNTNNLEVVVNGLELISGTDYTESSASSVTLAVALEVGDEVLFKSGGRLTAIAIEADVAYTYPGTAAVARTQGAKLDEQSASPEDWGALADGVTDDTAAFQLAVNWLQSSGAGNMTLKLAAKPYRLTGTVTVSGAVQIQGEGYVAIQSGRPITRPTKGSWLVHANATGPLFKFTGAAAKGSSLTGVAFFQEGHPDPAPGWAPAVRDWVIRAENMEGELFLDRVHFHNVYRGVLCDFSHRPRFGHLSGQFFSRAVTFDRIYDTGSLKDLHAWTFWSEDDSVLTWTQANGIAVSLGRVDGMDIGSLFTFALAQNVYCGASPAGVSGGARVVNIDRIYADYTGRALVIDNSVSHVTVNSLFHLGQVWPSSPVAALSGSCGVHVASGSNSHVQIGTYYGTLCTAASVKVEGTNNQVTIESPIFEQYDKSASGAGPISGAATNLVYLGNAPQALNYAGAATDLITGAAAMTVKVPLAQQFLGGIAKNKVVTAANTTAQFAVVTAEGDADAGLALLAQTTGTVQVGSAANKLSFYGGAAVPKQTGVLVTAAGIHAALVSLGLIAP